MSVYSMYFSPTGGVKRVMDILTEGFSMDNLTEEEMILLRAKAGSQYAEVADRIKRLLM